MLDPSWRQLQSSPVAGLSCCPPTRRPAYHEESCSKAYKHGPVLRLSPFDFCPFVFQSAGTWGSVFVSLGDVMFWYNRARCDTRLYRRSIHRHWGCLVGESLQLFSYPVCCRRTKERLQPKLGFACFLMRHNFIVSLFARVSFQCEISIGGTATVPCRRSPGAGQREIYRGHGGPG